MSRKMLINATHPEENRVAIVEDGILTELDIEVIGREQTRGNIYKATVVRVEQGLQAAFIDYGGERFGFLQMGEIHPSLYPGGEDNSESRRPRINDVLRRGQELLVQVVKGERGTKGAALTTFLSLPGRYMVLMPDSDTKGVSRKIEEESQRKKLKESMNSLQLPADMGYIVRTAGIGQKKEELKRDFDYLVRVHQNILELSKKAKTPALIYKESNLVIRSIRDYFTSDIDEVLVDDPKVYQEAKDFFQQVMPEYAKLVKLHQERRPIFARYQIEEQIETIVKNKVPLPSGGSIVIDPTEALVAIDVNSGKMAGEHGVEATAYKTNLEAAEEAARQLRLRDLGGLIVIDFIDMRDRKHMREVEKSLKDALKNDKARVTIGKISQFGLLEMSRQRIKDALAEGSYLPCPHCSGSGRVKSAEAQAVAFLRKVHAGVAKGQIGRIDGEVPLEVATYLLNTKREELFELERRLQLAIYIRGRADFMPGQMELNFLKREKEEEYALSPVTAQTEQWEELPTRPPAPTAEPVEEPESPAEVPEGDEVQPAPGEEAGKKKRKRRRKKKPAGAEGTVEPAESPGTGSEDQTLLTTEGDTEGAEVIPEDEAAAESGEEGGLPAGETAAKKKRKRRRKKKPAHPAGPLESDLPAEAAMGTDPTETTAAANPEPAMATTDDTASAPDEVEKKKRKRHRKKKPTAPESIVAAATGEFASTEASNQPPAMTDPIMAAAPPPAEISPTEKAPRKGGAKAKNALETVPAAQSTPVGSTKVPGADTETVANSPEPASKGQTAKPKTPAKPAKRKTPTATAVAAEDPASTETVKSVSPRKTPTRKKAATPAAEEPGTTPAEPAAAKPRKRAVKKTNASEPAEEPV